MEIKFELIPLIALIIGGLALFLYGITSLSNSLKELANGDRFRRMISKATSNPIKSCAIGTGFTTIIQSSGGTYALSIGLVKAGALEYRSAIAIVIGANLGTCITSFLISIPGISQFMPFVALIAAFVMMVVHSRKAQQWSQIAFSFSLIFFGIWLMEFFIKNGIATQDWFTHFMEFLNNYPWLGLLFGTAVTLIFQSCSAVIGVIQGVFAAAVLSGSPITLFGMLPIVIGSNIGAMIPAVLSAFGGNAMAKRVAFANGFMKVTAGLVFMGLLYAVQPFLNSLGVTENTARLQIAIFHLIFNLTSVLVFLPLLNFLCWMSAKVFPSKKSVGEKIAFTELDPKVMKSFPSTGLSLANDLSIKMFNYVVKMFECLDKYMKENDEEVKDYILELERAVDNIDRHLADFLLHAVPGSLSYTDQTRYAYIMRGIKDIERIGDYGENLLNFYSSMYEKKEKFDTNQKTELTEAHKEAIDIIMRTMKIYEAADKQAALTIIQERRDYVQLLDKYQNAYFTREMKKKGVEKASYLSLVYVDILNCYERVYAHCANIAKLFNSDKDPNRYAKKDETRFSAMASRY
ncbi:MAG: Na/Pi cotransporter family protein [Bacilli bacterium]|nr:Na/Pi cotransporter family protein [Bacilli bacterium]